MTEVWFYHLETQPLERVLPALLQRALDRGWRACVQSGSPERLAALDAALWTYDEASFLPHGPGGEPDAARQPVLLMDGPSNPNGAAIRILVDRAAVAGALAEPGTRYERAVLLFDGGDDEALHDARKQWSALKASGYTVTYWQQDDNGRWEKRA